MKRCEEYGRVSDFTDGERCPSCKAFVPDADVIRLACLAIRKTWSPGTRLTRTNEAYRPQHADTPQAHAVTDHMRRRDHTRD